MQFILNEKIAGHFMIDFHFNLGFTDTEFFDKFRDIGKLVVEEYLRYSGPLYPNFRWVTIRILTDKKYEVFNLVSQLDKYCWCITMRNVNFHPPKYIDHKRMLERIKKSEKIVNLAYLK